MKIIINNKQRRARDTVKDIWPKMTIDTRGPARRRETVRDKNANGESREKGSNAKNAGRHKPVDGRRSKGEDDGGRTECESAERAVRRRRSTKCTEGDERCVKEAEWSAATDRVRRLPNVEYSMLTAHYCRLLGSHECRTTNTRTLPATAYSASTRHSMPPLFPPVHDHRLAAHPPVRTVLSI